MLTETAGKRYLGACRAMSIAPQTERLMRARIYRPAKSAMQSGYANSKDWVLEFEAEAARSIDPLMGWTSSSDTSAQVRLEFDSAAEAVAYAERAGIAYTLSEPKPRKAIRKAYADNFRFGRMGSWTH